MLWFNKDRIPPGMWPFLQATRVSLQQLQELLIDRIDLTEGTNTVLTTGCLQAYRQAVLRRVLDLTQAIIVA